MCLGHLLTAAEGCILGVGANMLKVAGPVIVYGTVAGGLWGYLFYNKTRQEIPLP